MHAFRIGIILLSSILISCGSEEETYEELIPRSKMQTVLLEMHLSKYDEGESLDWKHKIFEEHDVDSSAYAETLRYYSLNPDSAQLTYDWVQDQLSERREQVLADERMILSDRRDSSDN